MALVALLLSACERSSLSKERYYTLETVVGFGTGGASELYRAEGWANAERFFAWALGPRAQLVFNVRYDNRPLGVRMRLASLHKAPELPFQDVVLTANDVPVAQWQVAKVGDFTAVIPPAVLKRRSRLTLDLLLPNATSPKSLGIGPDLRPLGVSCFELQITKAVAVGDVWDGKHNVNEPITAAR